MKIVVINSQDFNSTQKERLSSLGDVTYYLGQPKDGKEYLQRANGADIICSTIKGFNEASKSLHSVYVTFYFVSLAFIKDFKTLKHNNVILSNAPGANKYAVTEWIMCMTTLLMRNLYDSINRVKTYNGLPPLTNGLYGSNITILGNGNVGKQVNILAKAYGMNVTVFKRRDDLKRSVKNANVIVNALSLNSSTNGLLDSSFFGYIKKGSYIVSVAMQETMDEKAMIKALDRGYLAGVATDCASIITGDVKDNRYKIMHAHPKILATPHIAYDSKLSLETGINIMIDNVEAYISGKPQNVIK